MYIRRRSVGDVIILHWGHNFRAPNVRNQHSSQWTCQQQIDTTGTRYSSMQIKHFNFCDRGCLNSRIRNFSASIILFLLSCVRSMLPHPFDEAFSSDRTPPFVKVADATSAEPFSSSTIVRDDELFSEHSCPPAINERKYKFSVRFFLLTVAGSMTSCSVYCGWPYGSMTSTFKSSSSSAWTTFWITVPIPMKIEQSMLLVNKI